MIERILADELVRLAMASDGVREDEMRRVLEQARSAVIRHSSGTSGSAIVSRETYYCGRTEAISRRLRSLQGIASSRSAPLEVPPVT